MPDKHYETFSQRVASDERFSVDKNHRTVAKRYRKHTQNETDKPSLSNLYEYK